MSVMIPRGALAERWATGVGIGVRAGIQLPAHLTVYASYTGTQFDLDPFKDSHAIDSGLGAGVIRSLPIPPAGVEPWIAGGVLVHRLRIDGDSRPADGGRLGLEVAAGLNARPASAFQPTLAIGYRRYEARIFREQRDLVSYFHVMGGLKFRLPLGR